MMSFSKPAPAASPPAPRRVIVFRREDMIVFCCSVVDGMNETNQIFLPNGHLFNNNGFIIGKLPQLGDSDNSKV